MSQEIPQQTRVEINTQTPEMTENLSAAPLFEKTAKVQAREAIEGEVIQTVLEDGTVETSNTASAGDVVITNPGGEQYIIGNEKFMSRYEPTEDVGVFKAKGMVRAIDNPTGGDILVIAPWGEVQIGGPDAKILVSVDPENPDAVIGTDRYIIGGQEFLDTYGPVVGAGPLALSNSIEINPVAE
jgi:hypothetical protein